MNKTFKRLGIVLLVLLVVAAIFYTVYKINEPSANETVIKETYDNQLDAILFSLNQYSEDVVSKWMSQVDALIGEGDNIDKSEYLLHNTSSIKYIFFSDSLYRKTALTSLHSIENEEKLLKDIKKVLQQNQEKIDRLFTYRKNGYRKLEPIDPGVPNNLSMLIFLPNPDVKNYQICGFLIDPEVFIQEILAPRMQGISQGRFVISISNWATDQLEYSTDENLASADVDLRKRDLWLLPQYTLGISLKGQTIDTLAAERFNTYLYLILGLNAMLIIGVFFAYRNIKKEVRLAKIKSDFVSNVSHEIRTPLALISMFAETLQMDRVKSEEKKQEYYTIISQEANRLAGIVNKILNFSQIEAGKRNFTFEKVNLNEVVEDVMRSYEFHLNNLGFTYTFKPGKDLLQIHGDKEAITEAIINLLDNAVKYSNHHKDIIVRTGMRDGQTFVEISDKGVGISPKDQKAIFDKFYRVTNGEVHNVKGTGLGLALVKHIVDAHKGKIDLISAQGVGSTFRLSFPGKYNVSKLIAQ